MDAADFPDLATTLRIVFTVAFHQSSGFCSHQSGLGETIYTERCLPPEFFLAHLSKLFSYPKYQYRRQENNSFCLHYPVGFSHLHTPLYPLAGNTIKYSIISPACNKVGLVVQI